MMRLKRLLLFFFCTAVNYYAQGQHSFKVIPLGVKGGLDESNLSSYLVADAQSENYVCLDAGTLRWGIEKAVRNKLFKVNAEQVLRTNVKGYLISHPHLDHLSGLVLNAPADSNKNIYAFKFV